MSATAPPTKPRVLFVDDEKRLVDVYADIFAADYEIHIATSGKEALQMLRQLKNVAMVVSDFHMPQMDGATLLQQVMQQAPYTTRILLTGTGGLDSAKEAVNRGQIFRFLSKPCPLDQLRGALEAGLAQYRLLNAERLVLQETLIECIEALMDVLAVTNPLAFGRAHRVNAIVQFIAEQVECIGFWQLEAASLLSQIGYFSVSPELAEKMYYGRELTHEEQARAASVPANTQRLLEHIPRLEPVIQILSALDMPDVQITALGDRMMGLGGRMLGAALEYDGLVSQGISKPQMLQALRARETRFGKAVIDALVTLASRNEQSEQLLEIPLRQAAPGMRLRQELRTPLGALLVPMGMEISARLIDRISQVAPELLDASVKLAPPLKA